MATGPLPAAEPVPDPDAATVPALPPEPSPDAATAEALLRLAVWALWPG